MHTKRLHIIIKHQLLAMRGWMDDLGQACHLLVNLEDANPLLKDQASQPNYPEGIGLLSIGSVATRHFVAGPEGISFNCRKKGVEMEVNVPYDLMMGVRDPEVGLVYLLDASVVNTNGGEPAVLIHTPVIPEGEEAPKELQAPKPRPTLSVVK